MTIARTSAPTLFGKLPTHGDFVVRGERGRAEAALAAWLTAAVETARGQVPGQPVRFVATPAEGPSLVGCWVASRDAVGRAFPLVASCAVAGAVLGASQACVLACTAPLEAWVERTLASATQPVVASRAPFGEVPESPGSPLLDDLPCRLGQALSATRVRAFAASSFAHAPGENLTYALSVLQRAARLPGQTLTLDVPAPSQLALYVWLALLRAYVVSDATASRGALASAGQPTMLLWSPALGRALLCLGSWSSELLVYLGQPQHQGHARWPLWTQRPEAAALARRELAPATLDCIDRDEAIATLLARVAKGEP